MKQLASPIKKVISFNVLLIIFTLAAFAPFAARGQAAQKSADILLADPTVFFEKGVYYLYGTVEGDANLGFKGYSSKDMKSWKPIRANDGYALRNGESFGTANFWAPQIFRNNKQFLMAYAANENIAIAAAISPLGRFTQKKNLALPAPVKQIDPFVFIDEDGKKYLYHVRLTNGNRIFVAEMTDDFSNIKPETLRECITATEAWENTSNAAWPVAEGPSIVKRKGSYYLFYTANDFRNPDYAVGYATASSPLGPWKKYEGNPIISKKNVGVNGPGHGDFFTDNAGSLNYVFHTHQSQTKVTPRKTAMIRVNFSADASGAPDKVIADENTFVYLKAIVE